MRSALAVLACLTLAHVAAAAEDAIPREQLEFFEAKIRPVFIEHCYQCHSAERGAAKGSLVLDSRNGWKSGGDSGPAISPEDPEGSLLLEALKYESYEMPPKGKLPDEVIADFEKVDQDGRSGSANCSNGFAH